MGSQQEVSLVAHASNPTSLPEIRHFWSQVVGAGRANEGLRADWQQHLKIVARECGFRYVRFHGLYHDDMHVYNEVNGEIIYNFQYIDALIDALLDAGVRPFVEFGFCPSKLASQLDTVFWWGAHGSPPKDLVRWGQLIHATVLHWVSRYGSDEVRSWYFECWNEPNLKEFFAGSRSSYYALYEETVKAVKSVDSALRVGGPATSNFVPDSRFDGEVEDLEAHRLLNETSDIDSLKWSPVWIEHFLKWCHEKELPVDFVSCHPYPTDWALDTTGNEVRRVRSVNATPEDISLIRQVVLSSPYCSAEIHLTEWSSSPTSRDHQHDHVPAAAYIMRTLLASTNMVDTIAYWTFTDVFEEEGAGLEPFHGGFGMINLQGIVKPTFHVFRFLHQLGNEMLARHNDHGIITRSSTSGFISAILFHYPPEMTKTPPISYRSRDEVEATLVLGKPMTKSMVIEGLKPGTVFKVEILAPGRRGDVISAWNKIGAPTNLSRQTTEQLKEEAVALECYMIAADTSGILNFTAQLTPWTILCFTQAEGKL